MIFDDLCNGLEWYPPDQVRFYLAATGHVGKPHRKSRRGGSYLGKCRPCRRQMDTVSWRWEEGFPQIMGLGKWRYTGHTLNILKTGHFGFATFSGSANVTCGATHYAFYHNYWQTLVADIITFPRSWSIESMRSAMSSCSLACWNQARTLKSHSVAEMFHAYGIHQTYPQTTLLAPLWGLSPCCRPGQGQHLSTSTQQVFLVRRIWRKSLTFWSKWVGWEWWDHRILVVFNEDHPIFRDGT